jgi:modulator of FtsH protease
MDDRRLQPAYPAFGGAGALAGQRHRVLRNTYWLLALSLVPTVLGAWIGVSTGLFARAGALVSIASLVIAFGLIFVIHRTKDSAAGVFALLGFTFFMGLMMSNLLLWTLQFRNGPQLIMTAFGGTAGVFLAMAALATVVKRDLGGLAKFLFVGLVIVVIASLINLFVQSSAAMLAINVAVMGIFAAFMLVDVKRILDGGETNYITATLNIYLDLVNFFTALLQLLGIFGGDRE